MIMEKQEERKMKKIANIIIVVMILILTGTISQAKTGAEIIFSSDLEKLYAEVKSKYDVLYKDMNVEKNRKLIIFIAIMLGASLALNIINFIVLMKK